VNGFTPALVWLLTKGGVLAGVDAGVASLQGQAGAHSSGDDPDVTVYSGSCGHH
jgi:hypothetical protein